MEQLEGLDLLPAPGICHGIADELYSDGGPEFTAAATRTFLTNWGVHNRLSSVAFPHSNCRAEVGVNTSKRMIMDNTDARDRLDTACGVFGRWVGANYAAQP